MLGFASCDDKSDLGVQQKNAQENVLSLGGITVNPQAPFNGTSINLDALKGQTLNVLTYTSADPLPAGAYMEYKMELAATPAFENAQTINLNRGENATAPYTVNADEVSAAINAIFGREPVAHDVQIRIAAYIVNGTQLLRIREDEAGAWFMAKQMSITPIDPQLDIEAEYFLVNSLTGMSLTQAEPMLHGSKHQYDDPNFSAVIDVTVDDLSAGNVKWQIAPASAVANEDASNLFGAAAGADLTAMKGEMVKGGVAFEIVAPAKYQIRVNMEDLTYEIGFANEQLYLWTPQTKFGDNVMGLFTDNYVNYDGIICTDPTGKWKLTGECNMRSLQIGCTDVPGQLAFGKETTAFETPADDRSKLMRLQANLQDMTYTMIVANTFGVVGGNNNWGNTDEDKGILEPIPDTPFTMTGTPAANGMCIWEADVTFEDENNLEFKLRANNAWNSDETPSFDLGADNNATTTKPGTPVWFGGANLSVESVGTYHITLNLNIGKDVGAPQSYTVTIEKK